MTRGRRPRRAATVLALALAALLAGCSAGYTGTPDAPTDAPATGTPTPTPAPEDRIGWEDGYAATDTLAVNTSDGVNETELDAIVARTTARVETIRGVEFTGDVTVELFTRAEYRERNVTFTRDAGRATDARWEAAFLVGEDTDAERAVDALFGGGVAGYYLPGEDRIVLVGGEARSASGNRTKSGGLNTRTLAHELVHALQHRRGWTVPARDTLDGRLAGLGLTEGEAVVVTRAYAGRCGEAWSCLSTPASRPDNVDAVVAYQGLYLSYRAPYFAGPDFVAALRERGGWDAVTAAYERPPTATRELLDPAAYPVDAPDVAVPDRSDEAWERYATDSLGRTTLHATFWANQLIHRGDDRIATDYQDGYSRGLVADRLALYRSGEADGYVWRLRFADAGEARQFHEGYLRLLDEHDAREVRDGVYRIEDGPFADAFRVTRDGDSVTVVNAPAVAELDDVGGGAS